MPETSIRTVERPVFVADDERRARCLALGARAAAALVATWAFALGVGGVGFQRLPALHPAVTGQSGVAPLASRPHPKSRGRRRVALRCATVRDARARSLPCRSVAV